MRYIRLLLMPEERVLFRGRIHPILYARGFALLLGSVALMYYLPEIKQHTLILKPYIYKILRFAPLFKYTPHAVSLLMFVAGVYDVLRAYVISTFTEFAVTDRRVIAKIGVFTTTTVEMDKRRIAEVIVTQTVMGRLLNYGWVTLRGFAGDITGLPAIANPNGLQQQILRA